ncbi:DNA polymerase IV [Roseiterribacter gracilis]|uniref:DNA polymerase IV n=1 Tax=Roseiterribacter gracilis TaxID=2812848 RepID=UPI003B427AA2
MSLTDHRSRCPNCGSPRLIAHAELTDLSIAHIDCDAFYATVEKREDPSLIEKPVIVGGGRRGVVSAACYVARRFGVRSAMPMFKALSLCPDAVVIRPRMELYAQVGRQVRAIMRDATPLVEALSIDEAFLDLTGTAKLHRAVPAETLAKLARQIEAELGVTVSIGLAPNKFLAKMASEIDKPRGFAVVGRNDIRAFLDPQPIRALWGVGPKLEEKLQRDGYKTIGDLFAVGRDRLIERYGSTGLHLSQLAAGEDARKIEPGRESKSVSAETTFNNDLIGAEALHAELWPLAEKVSRRMKRENVAARTIVLTLRTTKFKRFSRRIGVQPPTQLATVLFETAQKLLAPLADAEPYRLIGVGGTDLVPPEGADTSDLVDPTRGRTAAVERAIDALRAKHGNASITKGRGFKPT